MDRPNLVCSRSSAGKKEARGNEIEERRMERAKRKETAASYESRTYFRSAKCKQNDSPVMHRGIWRKSSSCDDWFQWYQPTLALYQLERHIYYPSPPRLEQMLRCSRPIRTTAHTDKSLNFVLFDVAGVPINRWCTVPHPCAPTFYEAQLRKSARSLDFSNVLYLSIIHLYI